VEEGGGLLEVGDDGDGEAEEWGGERGEVVVVMEEEGVGVVEV